MKRDEALAEISRLRTDEIVIPAYHSAFDWMRISSHPLDFYAIGAMGLASSTGLGFAMGMPHRRIVVIDGDGSLLMNLGTLVTIAEQAPANFVHFVSENGTYEANGAHPTPGSGTVDFAGFARAAGYREAHVIDDLYDLKARLPAILASTGPVFVVLRVEPGEKSPRNFKHIHGREPREAFRAALWSGQH